MTTTPLLADDLDEVTRQQRTAQDEHEDAGTALAVLRGQLADASAAGITPTADDLARLRIARDRVELAELRVVGLARRRQHLADEHHGTTAPPPVDDPRGVVTIRIAGRLGRHACNLPSTGRALEGGQQLDVPAADALALAELGYAELVGARPAWWPSRIPATGQALAAAR